MLDSNQSWSLFGYDLRQLWYSFSAGWRDFLWGAGSPVLPLIDETVLVHSGEGEPLYYQAGKLAPKPAGHEGLLASAVLLPNDLVLTKALTVPKAAEDALASVLAIEVEANSPFPADDTCYGWSIVGRGEQVLNVQLAISSYSAVMEFIAEQLDCHDIHAYEVWAKIDQTLVVFSGFGEAPRQGRNKKRVITAAVGIAYCLAALVLLFALSAGLKYLELQEVKKTHQSTELLAATAVKMRKELSAAKAQMALIDELIAENPDPHAQLARLSHLLDDSSWVDSIDMSGRKIRISGASVDASGVMKKLTNEPAYERVSAPTAIRKEARSGNERFVLDVTLATGGEQL